MNKPDISVFGSAHRPKNWMSFYQSLGNNDVNFEVIFVGPNEPDFKLPDNFRFIKSLVKPAQCWEIAVRNSIGDLIINVADDEEFKGAKNPLDKLYSEYKSYNDDRIILSCIYTGAAQFYDQNDSNSPIMPVSGLISRKLYRDIGGIDRNFIGTYWDLDIAMRIYALGGRVIISKDIYAYDSYEGIDKQGPGRLWNAYPDRQYLDYLWSNGKSFNRAKSVEPFSDERILEESQGPKGRWI